MDKSGNSYYSGLAWLVSELKNTFFKMEQSSREEPIGCH